MAGEPVPDDRGLVRSVVVADQVDVKAGRDVLVDLLQELQELLVAVPAVQLADRGAVGDVEGGEQAGDAVAGVVVGAPLGHPRHHRQHRLGPVQGLGLRLLVHAEDHGLLRRVVVEADDVDDLLHEQRVRRQLEPVEEVRLQVEPPPDPADRGLRQAAAAGHRGPRPVRRVPGDLLQGGGDDLLNLVQQDRRRPARPLLIAQPVQPALDEPAPPPGHVVLAGPQLRRYGLVLPALRAGQHDLRAQRQYLRGLATPCPPGQLLTLGARKHEIRLPAPWPRGVRQPRRAGLGES